MRIVLGTRGSDLARAQTALVEHALRLAFPTLEIAVEIIQTSGDEKSAVAFEAGTTAQGRKGMFTSEIERALRDRRIDVAVHSAKDLPSETPPELEVVAALVRAPVEDVLIAKAGRSLTSLPARATIATGSVRRQHQLRRVRPDLMVVDLRGNVPTRLRKLAANSWDGIILARAGLERLGYDCAAGELRFEEQIFRVEILPTTEFLPAGGQGIVALEVRVDDEPARRALAAINHEETLLCLRAEREFLRLLQGDCGTPVGVNAKINGKRMTLHAQLFTDTQSEPRSATLASEAGAGEPEILAARLLELING
ncbi:MAG: hydroxymethylbilane synthase [Chthoniobacterales bacterium]